MYLCSTPPTYTAPWSDVGVLSLTANDSDFFKIWLNELDWLTAITFPIQTNYTQPDTVMALFDGTGTTAIVYNDDAGSGFGSAIRWQATASGYYYIAITGYHGGGQSSLSYYEGATHSADWLLHSDAQRGACAGASQHDCAWHGVGGADGSASTPPLTFLVNRVSLEGCVRRAPFSFSAFGCRS
jgi:hypothetical protein